MDQTANIKFANRTEATADIVVDCDVIRSPCRSFVYGKYRVLTGTNFTKMAYRGLIPMEIAEQALLRRLITDICIWASRDM